MFLTDWSKQKLMPQRFEKECLFKLFSPSVINNITIPRVPFGQFAISKLRYFSLSNQGLAQKLLEDTV